MAGQWPIGLEGRYAETCGGGQVAGACEECVEREHNARGGVDEGRVHGKRGRKAG